MTQTEVIDGWEFFATELYEGKYMITATRGIIFDVRTINADNIDDAIADAYHELCEAERNTR